MKKLLLLLGLTFCFVKPVFAMDFPNPAIPENININLNMDKDLQDRMFGSDNSKLICTTEHGETVCTDSSFVPYTGMAYAMYGPGKLKSRFYLKNGKPDGVAKTYYENGQLQGEGYFKDGKLDGIAKVYYENGQPKRERIFKYGEFISYKDY